LEITRGWKKIRKTIGYVVSDERAFIGGLQEDKTLSSLQN
jgi:hypothetical protein